MSLEQRMTDRRPGQRMSLDEQGKLLPVERSSLTTPIQPFEQDPRRFHQERLHRTYIEGHPVVLDVSAQLRTENRPDVFQRIPASNRPAPDIYRLQLSPHPLTVGFHLRSGRAIAGSSPIKGKSQKVEDARPGLAASGSSEVDQSGLLFVQRKFVPGQPTAERLTNT